MTNRGRIMLMLKWKGALLGAVLFMSPVSAQAQDESAAMASEPANDRLVAAAQLMDLIMPPTQRDAMMDQMMQAIMTTMMTSVKDRPSVAAVMQNPEVEAVFDRFVDQQQKRIANRLKTEMPGMLTAMSRAYARRFTTSQLAELQAFFGTPTGQVYTRESLAILSDPDIAAWQRNLMTKHFEEMPQELETLIKDLEQVLGKPIEEAKA